MRISDWSSDVCSSDLRLHDACGKPALRKIGRPFHVDDDRVVGNLLLDSFQCIHYGSPDGGVKAAADYTPSPMTRCVLLNLTVELAYFVDPPSQYVQLALETSKRNKEMALTIPELPRSEERRVGKECVHTCSARWK